MVGRKDGWTPQIDGWMDIWMDGANDGGLYEWMDGWMEE